MSVAIFNGKLEQGTVFKAALSNFRPAGGRRSMDFSGAYGERVSKHLPANIYKTSNTEKGEQPSTPVELCYVHWVNVVRHKSGVYT